MKKTLLITVGLCALVITLGTYFVCNATPLLGKTLRGSGKMITRTIDAPAFEGIDASRAVKVVITDQVTGKITVEADDNVIDHVVVKAHDGELKVGISNQLKNISNMNVTVTVPNNGKIRYLDASSAASIKTAVALQADAFEISASSASKIAAAVKSNSCSIDASSASEIKVALDTRTCEMETSSASKISATVKTIECTIGTSSGSKAEVSGTAVTCEANLSSGSRINAPEFAVENYDINASSGSHAEINCTKSLTAGASSGAGITYTGDCTAQISKSSGGSVRKN